jgi:prepilin peptidase CpaA
MLTSAVVLAVGLPAIWIDTRTHRIPNALVGATLLAGGAIQVTTQGTAGIGLVLGGIAVGLLFFLPLYMSGAMGAGDVKLMAALGALVGPQTAAIAVAFTLVAGSALALATIGWRRWSTPGTTQAEANSPLMGRIPYAGAIVTGTLAATLLAA